MSVNRTLCIMSKYSRQLCNSKMMIPLNINICTAASTAIAVAPTALAANNEHQFNYHWNQLQQQFNRYQCYQNFLNCVTGNNKTVDYNRHYHYTITGSSALPLQRQLWMRGGDDGVNQRRHHSTVADASNKMLNRKRRNSEDQSHRNANDNQAVGVSVSGTDVISNKKNYTTALSNMTKDQANDLVFRLTDNERTLLLQVLTQYQSNQERKRLEGKPVSQLKRLLFTSQLIEFK